jgi:hypothetical protein
MSSVNWDDCVCLSIKVVKSDRADIELIPEHAGKCLHYLGLKDYKVQDDCKELNKISNNISNVSKEQWESWVMETKAITDQLNNIILERFNVLSNDPFIPKSKRYPARLASHSRRQCCFFIEEIGGCIPWYFCLCGCLLLIVLSTLRDIYNLIVVDIFGQLVGIVGDLCTGMCVVPCMEIQYGPDHVEWLNANLFNHPEYATKHADDAMQEALNALVKKIRSEVAQPRRVSLQITSDAHDDDDGTWNNISFTVVMHVMRVDDVGGGHSSSNAGAIVPMQSIGGGGDANYC